MFCYNCGKEIDDKAVVCIHCGVATKNMNSTDKNIIINNKASSNNTNPTNTKRKKKYNLFLDIILIFCTGGLWLFWMLMRPKYEY